MDKRHLIAYPVIALLAFGGGRTDALAPARAAARSVATATPAPVPAVGATTDIQTASPAAGRLTSTPDCPAAAER